MVECKALADNRMRGIKQAFSLSVLFLVSLASGKNDSVSDTGIVQGTPVQTTSQIMVTPEQSPTVIDENPPMNTSSTVVMPTQTPDQNNRVSSTPALPDWAIILIIFGFVAIIAIPAVSVKIFVRCAHRKYAK